MLHRKMRGDEGGIQNLPIEQGISNLGVTCLLEDVTSPAKWWGEDEKFLAVTANAAKVKLFFWTD